MAASEFQRYQDSQRANLVRLRTLVILRWFAIIGQTSAVLVATMAFDLALELGPIVMTIGASVLANLFSSFLYPQNKRLSERETTLILVFDILQLSLLLYLTGGLSNPFALLIVAPVTIAATALRLMPMVALAALTIALVTLIGLFHVPLLTTDGVQLELPILFRFGVWTALVIGVLFLALYTRRVTSEMHAVSDALVATQLALAREQKLTDLGGVVAAAAHELGTPLATIKLVSGELMDDLEDPQHREDAALIRSQADRCRDILRSMGRAGKDDLLVRRAPLEAVVREAAEPHMDRGPEIVFRAEPGSGADSQHPVIERRPEVIHGLRNLVQNAVDFASHRIEVDSFWTAHTITIRITDDGPGFPQNFTSRIGDPFIGRRNRTDDRNKRPGYEGMGLGLFIAKTLLERTGARLSFANRSAPGTGAVVQVVWRRSAVEDTSTGPLGSNQPIRPETA